MNLADPRRSRTHANETFHFHPDLYNGFYMLRGLQGSGTTRFFKKKDYKMKSHVRVHTLLRSIKFTRRSIFCPLYGKSWRNKTSILHFQHNLKFTYVKQVWQIVDLFRETRTLINVRFRFYCWVTFSVLHWQIRHFYLEGWFICMHIALGRLQENTNKLTPKFLEGPTLPGKITAPYYKTRFSTFSVIHKTHN